MKKFFIINLLLASTLTLSIGAGATPISLVIDNSTENATTIKTPYKAKEIGNKSIARVIIQKGKETEILDETSNMRIQELLKKHSLNPAEYSYKNGDAISSSHLVNLGEEITIKTAELNAGVETIELKLPDVIEETDTLYADETEIAEEGKVGKAIRTTIVSDYTEDKNTSEISTTILEAPKAKVIKQGTKERPAPEPEPTPEAAPELGYTPSTSGGTSSGGWGSSGGTSTPSTPTLSSGYTTDSSVVNLALKQEGKQYIWASAGPNSFDCSGLVHYVFTQNGYRNVPRTSGAQGAAGIAISKDQLQPGDLLWNANHIAIYIGNNKVIHASSPTRGVVVDPADWLMDGRYRYARLAK